MDGAESPSGCLVLHVWSSGSVHSSISSALSLRQAEKMRRQKEYANAIREQNKKTNKLPITPTKEPQHKDVPRMKVRDGPHGQAGRLHPSTC